MQINRDSSTPSYIQLASHLKAAIIAGVFKPGHRLPTEAELIKRSSLSRITVRRGLATLEKEGWVVRRQGLGTFVRSAVNQELSNVETIGKALLAQGITPRIKVLTFGAVQPPEPVRALFGLKAGEELLLAERIYYRDNEPIVFLKAYMPLSMREHAEVLSRTDVPTETTFMMWERIGVRLKGASHAVRAGKADAEDAAALGIAVGDPVLILDRITYAEDGRPVELNMFHYHWQRYELSVMVPRITAQSVPT